MQTVRVVVSDRGTIVVVALSLLMASGWWWATAEDRRIESACDSWLLGRQALQMVVSESDEAAERAQASGADIRDEFNDVDLVLGTLARWSSGGYGLSGPVPASSDDVFGSSDEQVLRRSLMWVDEEVGFLNDAIETGDPDSVVAELPEMRARLGIVDETCWYAARA